jgi:hypothetical protein
VEVYVRVLSVFTDEAGNFGQFEAHNRFYALTLVFHDQEDEIDEDVRKLDEALGHTEHVAGSAVHATPLIRQDENYSNLGIDERRKQFFKLVGFTRKCKVSYWTVLFNKQEYDGFALVARIAIVLSRFLRENLKFFQGFDCVNVYYDNGQAEISGILRSAFGEELTGIEFRVINPAEYKLAQVADLICTLEMLAIKQDNKVLTASDKMFFYRPRELAKLIQDVRKKRFAG